MNTTTRIVLGIIVLALLVVWLAWSHNNKEKSPGLSPQETQDVLDSLSAPKTSAKFVPTQEQREALNNLSTPKREAGPESLDGPSDEDVLKSLQAQ